MTARLLPQVTWPGAQMNAGIAVKNRILIASEFINNSLAFLHLNNPSKPTLIKQKTVGLQPRCVLPYGDRWVVAACRSGYTLDVVDYSNFANLTIIQSLACPGGPSWLTMGAPGFIYATCVDAISANYMVRKYAVNTVAAPFLTEIGTGTPVSAKPISVSHNGAGLLAVVGMGGLLDILDCATMTVRWSGQVCGSTQLAHVKWINPFSLLLTDYTRARLYTVNVPDWAIPSPLENFVPLSANPSQFLALGSRAYVPSLTNTGTPGAMDIVNLDDAGAGHRITTLPAIGSGSGFMSYFRVGNGKANIYQTSHFPPYGLDIYEVDDTGDEYGP